MLEAAILGDGSQRYQDIVTTLWARLPEPAPASMRARTDPPQVLVLTTYDTEVDILAAIDAGAAGYLLKDAPPEELFRAVRGTARGDTVLAPAVAAGLRPPRQLILAGAH